MHRTKSLAILAVLVLVALVLWWARDAACRRALSPDGGAAPSASSPLLDPVESIAPSAERASVETNAPSEPAAEPPRARHAFPPEPASEVGTLELLVRWHDGTPAAGIGAYVVPWGASDALLMQREVTTDAHGACTIEQLAPGNATVYFDRARSTTAEIRAGERTSHEVTLAEGFVVRGRVLDEQGTGVAGASVVVCDSSRHAFGTVVATSAADGSYSIEHVVDGATIAARADGHAPSAQVMVACGAGTQTVLDLYLRGAGGALRGQVLDPDGVPLAGARVGVRALDFGRRTRGSVSARHEIAAPPSIEVRTDEQGRFACNGLAPGWTQVLVRARELPPLRESVTIERGETHSLELRMAPGGSVEGIVRAADGHPARDATVRAGERGDPAACTATVRADGSYRIEAIAAGTHELVATSPLDGRASATVVVVAGAVTRGDVTLVAGSRAHGRVVDEGGAPLAGWSVAAREASGGSNRITTTHEDGRFELTNVPAGARDLVVLGMPGWDCGVVLERRGVLPREDEIVLTVPRDRMPDATLRLRLASADGALPPDATVWIRQEAPYVSRQVLAGRDGEVRFEHLIPGTYALRAQAPGRAPVSARVEIASGQTLDLGELVLSAGGRIHARAVADAPPESIRTSLLLETAVGAQVLDSILVENGVGESPPLAPGEYVLRARGPWRTPADVRCDVRDGETVDVAVPLLRATGRAFELRPEEGAVPLDRIAWRVWDGAGRLDSVMPFTGLARAPGGGLIVVVGGLTLGSWRVKFLASDGRTGSVELVVDALLRTDETVIVTLR